MAVIRAILFSSAFHILLILALIWIAPMMMIEPKQTIEVELFPEGQILEALIPEENKQQIVRQTLVPEKLKAPEDETLPRFLSEQKQRVKVETQAAQSGMTANRNNQSPSLSKDSAPPQEQRRVREKIDMDKDGFKSVDISEDLREMARYSEGGTSTIGEMMPRDVKVGSFTALNTDRYLFYTFYARMEELIRYRWETRVQHAIDSFDSLTVAQAARRNWTTQVEFLLDRRGYLKKAMIMKESGLPPFDAAAVNAFKDAKIFPNPPQEMVQEDGFIHVKFSFTVNYSAPAVVGN